MALNKFPQPRKSLGQHFLRDARITAQIVRGACIGRDDLVLEIGPGRGALTAALLDAAAGVAAVEVDRDLVPHLRETFADARFFLHEGDILKINLAACLADASGALGLSPARTKLVANLPYNLSAPILERLIEARRLFADMTVMLQKEVVTRIGSPPGGKEYGYFSVFVQAYCEVTPLFDVPPQAFHPPPKVWSAVARLTPRAAPLVRPERERLFRAALSLAFGQRRKTLGKTLASLTGGDRAASDGACRRAEVDPGRRPETLSVADFVRVAEEIGRRLEADS
jgi:16S rRNA (adenine1518-N6/adenine1519-N6)-dimethyltransferase